MNKIGLIIKREYLARVRNRTFWLSTFLLPIVFLLFIFGSAFFAVSSKKEQKKIAIINAPEMFRDNFQADSGNLKFSFLSNAQVDTSDFNTKGYDALLDLNNDSVSKNVLVYSARQLDLDSKDAIETDLDKAFEKSQLQKSGISKKILDSITDESGSAYAVNNNVIADKGKSQKVNAELNYGIGFVCGILIYITMLLFGAMVMRGVMEEKTNRIAEIIVSSVKPFELMMGKILGIAAVGLTQLLLWIILLTTLSVASSVFLPHDILQHANAANDAMNNGAGNATLLKIAEAKESLTANINWLEILSFFIFYFLGGFLFYAALFASIGSAVNEDMQEAQSLMIPITMPVIFSFVIMSSNLTTPDNKVMVWASIIPFSSPIVMMGRLPGGVPFWQLALSVVFLVVGFIFTTWLAGKIYRTGILMYGKKPSWKEMLKWAFRKS